MPPKEFLSTRRHNVVRVRSRGYLPHWELEGATYFITYRLHDSLPAFVVDALRDYRVAMARCTASAVENAEVRRAMERQFNIELDSCRGSCVLRDPRAAAIVEDNLHHFNGARYRLHAYCVMPNHVHVLLSIENGWSLDRVVHSWKSYTSSMINRLLDRRGPLWHREYFDRIVMSPEDFADTRRYILENPDKAGLQSWRFVWSE